MVDCIPLILHVGHGKTGSSAIQSALALSTEALARSGVIYPSDASDDRARKGHITSGNIRYPELDGRYWQAVQDNPQARAILFSNEALFQQLTAEPARVQGLIQAGVPVRILLFTRNPLKHAVSSYGQAVKRGGATMGLEPFLQGYNLPAAVDRFLTAMNDLGAEVLVRNYANHSKRLLECMAEMLQLDPGVMTKPPVQNVNRSLTPSEMHLQRCFNAAWGERSSTFVSDALCNGLPDLPFEGAPTAGRDAYDDFVVRVQPMLDRVNARIPAQEAYEMEPFATVAAPADHDPGRLSFTPEQLELLAQSISSRIPQDGQMAPFFKQIRGLRPGQKLTLDEVETLRDFARIFRPGMKPLRRQP